MLEYSREILLDDIKGLDQGDLDYIAYEGANSIGALLVHIVAIEFVHQVITFEKRDLNETELAYWESALFLGEKAKEAIKNKPIEYYVNLLSETRETTLALLRSQKEEWLFEEHKWENGVTHNYYWLWYHVMEDEVNHRGQIRMIKKMLFNTP
ncbi:DinB family protein [Bacillus salitolerans]|uniref:DinB family protein n=1 Tax=Bacillus salitolerans TaxID=1437434 RepID=A0ABW4LWL5_9BACI